MYRIDTDLLRNEMENLKQVETQLEQVNSELQKAQKHLSKNAAVYAKQLIVINQQIRKIDSRTATVREMATVLDNIIDLYMYCEKDNTSYAEEGDRILSDTDIWKIADEDSDRVLPGIDIWPVNEWPDDSDRVLPGIDIWPVNEWPDDIDRVLPDIVVDKGYDPLEHLKIGEIGDIYNLLKKDIVKMVM